MKKYYLPILLLLVFWVSSCSQDDFQENAFLPTSEQVEFTACFEDTDSRTYIEQNNETSTYNLCWHQEDELSVFRGKTLNERFQFQGNSGDKSGSFNSTSAQTTASYNTLEEATNYAYYPYGEYVNITQEGVIVDTLPAVQKYAEKSFGIGTNVMMAVTEDMDDMNLTFKNVCGYFKFKFYGENIYVKSVTLKGNNGEILAGQASISGGYGSAPTIEMDEEGIKELTLNCVQRVELGRVEGNATEFWFVVPPTKFTKGFTITITDADGGTFTKTTDKPFEIKRNTIKPISPIHVETVFDLEAMKAKERAALIELYNMADGDNWIDKTNWCSDKPISEWYGVYTNDKGLIRHLDLRNNGVVLKDVPESFINLTCLDYLQLEITSTEFPTNVLKLDDIILLELDVKEYKGPLPKEISNLQSLSQLIVSGNFTSFPEELGTMTNLEYLAITGPWFGGETISTGIPSSIANLENLKHLGISYFNIPIEIPDWIYDMQSLEQLKLNNLGIKGIISEKISNLTELKWLWLHENALEGSIPNGITSLTKLENIILNNNNFTGNIPIGFSNLTKLTQLWIYGNRLSGELPYDFEQNPNYQLWGVEQNVMVQQQGYGLIYPSDAYVSTDYTKDGEVIELHKATKGNGVNIVLLGDGFVDKDMVKDGAFDQAMNEALGYLFALEPMKSYKEYFNVYAVKAVSKHNRFATGYETALGCQLGIAPYVEGNDSICMDYALKVPGISSANDLVVAVILNSNVYAGTTFWYEDGSGIAYIGMARPVDSIYEKTFEATFIHEVVGHAFAKLADEYVYINETHPYSGNMDYRNSLLESGYYANVDFISDPDQIKWAHLLDDERFSSYTGIVEGGELYKYGVWRPEIESMMRNNQPYFNAPSREAIVKRIMKLAGETYSFESFATNDEYVPLSRSRSNYVEKDFEPLPSPIIVNSPWKNAK